MADEIEEQFDASKLAEQIMAEEPAPEAEEQDEPAPSTEIEEEAPAPEAPAPAAEEEDDEKFVAATAGKPISQDAFKARLARWKKKETELSGKHQTTLAELEALRKAQPASAQDMERFKAIDGVFSNLDKAAVELPWVQDMLLALGSGKKPDWNKVKEGMEAYLASVPKGDPILYQQLEAQRAQIEEIQFERVSNQALTHVQNENVEIAKILGSDMEDPYTKTMWAILNEQANLAFKALNPKDFKSGPNRVEMAKRLAAASEAYHQRKLKGQIPPPTKLKAPNLALGKGAGAGNPKGEEQVEHFDPAALAQKILAAQPR